MSTISTTSITSPKWKTRLSDAGYNSFEDWWNASGELVEDGNFWGKNQSVSWSEVTRLKLDNGTTLYLKRQQNHRAPNAINWLKGLLTFEVEWNNFLIYQKNNIPSVNYIHFETRRDGKNKQCILVSEELDGMTSLENLIDHYAKVGWPNRQNRRIILTAILTSIKKLHDARILHNALKTKHIFISVPILDDVNDLPPTINACFIDLERSKFVGSNSKKFIFKDLEILARRAKNCPPIDLIWFFKQYIGSDTLTPANKKTLRKLIQRVTR